MYCIHVLGQMHLNKKQTLKNKIKILCVQSEVSCSSCTDKNGEQQDIFSVVVLFQMTDIKLV